MQTINNKIIKDHKEVSRKYYEKYKELRAERFRCIKQRAKEDLGLDLDMKDLEREDTEERITLDITTSDSGVAVMVDAATSEESEAGAGGENQAPPPIENEANAMEVPEAPEQPEQSMLESYYSCSFKYCGCCFLGLDRIVSKRYNSKIDISKTQ